MKKKFKIGITTIIITATISYLTQYWLKQSGMQDRILNTYDTVKIHKNYVGADSNLATKDLVVEGTVSAVHWLAEDNIEMLISSPAAQALNNN